MSGPIALIVGPFEGWEDLRERIRARGWEVVSVESGAEAYQILAARDAIVALVPSEMRDGPADNLLLRARAAGTRADFLLFGSARAHDRRAAFLEEGADEVFDLPADPDRILAKIDRLRERRRILDDLGLIVRDPTMLELLERILRIAPLKVTALITGESGTGKEMLAQALHRASDRRDGPFVAVNVGALPETLLESELFGHERGAFTSADARRIGRFELAHGGTLFLDEVGEMPLSSQVNLLRVLEEEEFLRVGGSKKIRVDVRIVAATNRDLEEMVREGTFRRDLYYRLNVVQFDVPPLRERRGEIPVLARELAARAASRHGVRFPGFTKDAVEALVEYSWPGNVRELRNVIDGLVALRPETPVRVGDLPAQVLRGAPARRALPAVPQDREGLERELVLQSLLALRAEVAALRDAVLGRGTGPLPHGAGDLGRNAYPAGASGFPPAPAYSGPNYPGAGYGGGAVYPSRPVRVEESESSAPLSLSEMERRAVERALREAGDNRRRAAQSLGISERTLYRRIKEFGLGEEEESRGDDRSSGEDAPSPTDGASSSSSAGRSPR